MKQLRAAFGVKDVKGSGYGQVDDSRPAREPRQIQKYPTQKYDSVKSSYAQDSLRPTSPPSQRGSKQIPKYEKEAYKGDSVYA